MEKQTRKTTSDKGPITLLPCGGGLRLLSSTLLG